MTNEEREALGQFLGGNWYDRPESDKEIVAGFVTEAHPEYVAEVTELIRSFLAADELVEAKAELIRKEAWRYVEGGPDAYVRWLAGVLVQLEQASGVDQVA